MEDLKKKRKRDLKRKKELKKEFKRKNCKQPYDALECAMILMNVIPDATLANILDRDPITIQNKRYSLRKKYKKMGILDSMEVAMA